MKQALWKAIEAYRHSTSIEEQWRNRDALDTLLNAALSLAEFDAAPVQAQERKPFSAQKIRELWASENGLEDCDMCKLHDFEKAFRAVEAALDIKERP